MAVSYPSTIVTTVDVPEVSNLSGEFVYNFFVPDEKTKEVTTYTDQINQMPSEKFDAAFLDKVERIYPRYVKLNFSPVRIGSSIALNNEFIDNMSLDDGNTLSVRDNLDKIISEDDFTAGKFMPIDFQDSGIDMKMRNLVSGSVARRINSINTEIRNDITDLEMLLQSQISNLSPLDLAKLLNQNTTDDVTPDFIKQALMDLTELGDSFYDDDKSKELINQTYEKIKNVSVYGRINSKIVGTVIDNLVRSPVGILTDDFSGHVNLMRSIQESAVSRGDHSSILESDIELSVEPVSAELFDASDSRGSSARVAGYIIDKTEMLSDGTSIEKNPIIIEGQSGFAVDGKVIYGRSYMYSIRTIVQLNLQMPRSEADEIVLAKFLISSRRSNSVIVNAIERVPPPPPSDFNISYSHDAQSARLMWSFPVNPQRDIKRFQIFRRKSIDEPFEIIQEIDFDDSEIKSDSNEIISEELIRRLSSPVTFYYDSDFDKYSDFIYTLTSIDAHGMTSNFGPQMRVRFDRFKNKMDKNIISISGAPKSYPNLYLLNDTFVDTIKTSGYSKINVVFDPEYLDLVDKDGRELDLISTDGKSGKFVMQIINTDLQLSKLVDIKVEDMRKTDQSLPPRQRPPS